MTDERKRPQYKNLASGLLIGIGVGVALGVALHSLALGIALGAGVRRGVGGKPLVRQVARWSRTGDACVPHARSIDRIRHHSNGTLVGRFGRHHH